MTMITPSYLGETIEYSSLHACRSTLEDPTGLGLPIQHIHADGSLEPHEAAEERLLKLAGQEHPSLFASHQQQVEEAYAKQGLKIAYRESDSQPEDDFQPASAS